MFLILGVVGLFLPFLQGILFLIIGILLLSVYSPSLKEWLRHRTSSYPKVQEVVIKAEDWIGRNLGEV